MKKDVGHVKESQQIAVTTVDLDLRENPDDINSLPDLENEVYEDVPNTNHQENPDPDLEITDNDNDDAIAIVEEEQNDDEVENVIHVKEYSPKDEDDLVFIQLTS